MVKISSLKDTHLLTVIARHSITTATSPTAILSVQFWLENVLSEIKD